MPKNNNTKMSLEQYTTYLHGLLAQTKAEIYDLQKMIYVRLDMQEQYTRNIFMSLIYKKELASVTESINGLTKILKSKETKRENIKAEIAALNQNRYAEYFAKN